MRHLLLTSIFSSLLFSAAYELKSGWNLVGFLSDLNSSKIETLLNENDISIWQYKNNDWQFVSSKIEQDIFEEISYIDKKEGVWINNHLDNSIQINLETNGSMDYYEDEYDLNIKEGWNLLSASYEENIDPRDFNNADIIWSYDDNWSVYKEGLDANDTSYPIISTLEYNKGFWVKNKIDENYNTYIEKNWTNIGSSNNINVKSDKSSSYLSKGMTLRIDGEDVFIQNKCYSRVAYSIDGGEYKIFDNIQCSFGAITGELSINISSN